jgi:hypothetical protein
MKIKEGKTEKKWGVYKQREDKNKYIDIAGFWDMVYCSVLINSEKLSCWMMRQPVGLIFTA